MSGGQDGKRCGSAECGGKKFTAVEGVPASHASPPRAEQINDDVEEFKEVRILRSVQAEREEEIGFPEV